MRTERRRKAMTIGPVRQHPIADARSRIDDAFLGEWEKRLQLESPDHLFRQLLFTVVAHYLLVPPGGLESASRKGLNEAKKYWSDMHTCLLCLLELLPHERFEEHPQACRMRIELIGNVREEEQATRIRELFEQRGVLEKWKRIAEAQMKALSEEPTRPNAKLAADRMLVSQLAGIFRERTGNDPREHIKVNSLKDEYTGEFFDFANAILRKVGSQQRSDRARGKMIKEQLSTLPWPTSPRGRRW
jgi:hypothetical protein